MKYRFLLALTATSVLAGCSATADKQKQIEAIAKHRATVLSSSLPIEHGPLTIMQARAKGNAVELMMLYNSDGGMSAQNLVNNSISGYCNDNEVKANLAHGIIYNIKLRSPRGQLLLEKVISEESCAALPNSEAKQ